MSGQLISTLPAVQAFLARDHGLFIDGATQAATSGARLDIRNPATGAVVATAANAGPDDVDAAVSSAHRAFTSGAWSGMRPADRERILLKLADLVEEHAEELAQLETLNQGKSLNISRAIEVGASVEYIRYMAGWATKISGETTDVSIPFPPGTRYSAYTRREPIGVVAGIVPWNFPFMIAVWKMIPALAAGCTVVLKPSPETPLTALRLAELALQAGVPAGVVNIVTGDGGAGKALVSHPLVSKVTFTGSTATGKLVGHAAIDNMARFTLELGGKNPMIVLADADVDSTVQAVLSAGFLNQGQVCAAASRLYIHRSKFRQITEGVAAAVDAMSLGPGMDLQAQINPLVSARQQQSVSRAVELGLSQGARKLAGSAGVGDLPGYFVRPTLLVDVDHRNALMRDEVFGPVMAAMPFDSEEEAVQLANDTQYGLAASLWTQNLSAALRLVPQIQAGTVWVNSHIPLDPSLPFGGYKQSGVGREFGKYAVEGCTELKSVCIAY